MPPKARPTDLAKQILSADVCPAHLLLIAPDAIRRERFVEALCLRFIAADKPREESVIARKPSFSSLQRLSAAEQKQLAAKLAAETASLSLFEPTRFFLIEDADELTGNAATDLIELLEKQPSGTHLIFTAASLNKSSIIYKYFSKIGMLLELEELKGADLARWVEKELRLAGIEKTPADVLAAIAHIGQNSPDQIASAVQQIALYLDGKPLTVEALDSVFSSSFDASEFEFLEAITSRGAPDVEQLLARVLASGKNPFMLLALLIRSFNSYYSIAALLKQGFSENEVRQQLNASPWVFGKQVAAARRYSLPKLRACLRALLSADSRLKNRNLGDAAVFSQLISELRA